MKIVAIIPARGNSKRLFKKNIYPVWNKPMIYWSIKACSESKFDIDTWVSTECEEIKKIATSFGAKIHNRQNALSQDHVFKQAVIRDAADKILEKNRDVDIFISLQANSPEIQAEHLDSAIEKFLKYNRSELFSVDKNLMQNAAFRIFKRDYVFQQDLSTNCGVFVCDIHDVHTEEDVMYLEKTQ